MEDGFNRENDSNVILKRPSLFGMIMSPKNQFEKMRANPIIWGALIMITVIFVIGTVLQMFNVDPSTMINEELEGILSPGDEGIVYLLSIFGSGLAALFMPIIIVLISSFIYWVVAKLVKSTVTFKQLFSMNTYILFINSLGILINGLLAVSIGAGSNLTYTSLGTFFQGHALLEAIFSNFELFGIWALILTAIGLQIVARFSKTAAWTVTILLFIIGLVFSMVGAAFGMLFSAF